jgi:DivIVA domain-containing protein
MRNLLNRLLGPRRRQQTLLAGLGHRQTIHPPLRPAQIRNQRFHLTRRGQRGLDPQEVHEFLNRIATELANAHAATDRHHAEATRIKNALKRWQTEQHNQHQAWQRQLNHSHR